MIKCSQLLRDSAAYSQTTKLVVDILQGNTVVFPDVPVLPGSCKISQDRGSKTRMTCDVSVILANRPDLNITNTSHRFSVRRGFQSLGVAETIKHGIFRIDDINYNDDGTIDIAGSGLEAYVIDARFPTPRTPPYGLSTIEYIKTLITEVLPGQMISVECSKDKIIQARAPWKLERWDAIESLAQSIEAEVFADYRGLFVIRDIPTVAPDRPAVYTIREGVGGTLMGRKRKVSRDKVYNAMVCSGQSSDQKVPPVWAMAIDNDPTSPTYYYGPFGQVPKFFSSQFFTTYDQCLASAKRQLVEALGANEQLSVQALPLTFLEPGDLINVEVTKGVMLRRILEKISFVADYDAAVDIDTLSPKDLSEVEEG
jgi:hypothetical protein